MSVILTNSLLLRIDTLGNSESNFHIRFMTTNEVYLNFCVPGWTAHFDVQPKTFVLSCRIIN
jgi:hypothetical protein